MLLLLEEVTLVEHISPTMLRIWFGKDACIDVNTNYNKVSVESDHVIISSKVERALNV